LLNRAPISSCSREAAIMPKCGVRAQTAPQASYVHNDAAGCVTNASGRLVDRRLPLSGRCSAGSLRVVYCGLYLLKSWAVDLWRVHLLAPATLPASCGWRYNPLLHHRQHPATSSVARRGALDGIAEAQVDPSLRRSRKARLRARSRGLSRWKR
jgi:hypothetical protein